MIATTLEEAARTLKAHKCKRFLLASDHGASRLAVIAGKEEKYETEIYEGEHRGRHSGRCCPAFSPYDLPFAAEENGWLVLADYGRFKGGRVADVEVHGGASLEEAVVPLVELSLKNTALTVELVESLRDLPFNQCRLLPGVVGLFRMVLLFGKPCQRAPGVALQSRLVL